MEKYGNKRYFSHKSSSKNRLHIEFTSCWDELMSQEALTSFTVLTHITSLRVRHSY